VAPPAPVRTGGVVISHLFRLRKKVAMLTWTIIFLVVALIAGLFGFGGIASTATGIARVLFFIFLVLFAISLLTSQGFTL
jgi:uncharacterized membrane protein YtjA (UPF0391 family)